MSNVGWFVAMQELDVNNIVHGMSLNDTGQVKSVGRQHSANQSQSLR